MRQSTLGCASLAVWLLAATSALVESTELFPLKEEYLMLPSQYTYSTNTDLTWRTVMLAKLRPGWPEFVADQVEEALTEADKDIKPWLLMLLDLMNDNGVCSAHTVLNYVLVYGSIKYTGGKLRLRVDPYIDFMKTNGARKFGTCAAKLESESAKVSSPHEHTLDNFFTAALGTADVPSPEASSASHDNDKLYELVRNFDMTRDKFNLGAAAVLPQVWHSKIQIIISYFSKACSAIYKQVGPELQAITLAESLGSHHTTDVRLLKLNEYMRICVSTTSGVSRDQFLQNVRSQSPT